MKRHTQCDLINQYKTSDAASDARYREILYPRSVIMTIYTYILLPRSGLKIRDR